MSEDWTDHLTMEELNFKKPESWDAKDFLFSSKYYCPICATPEDGKCQVLDDWEIEKWGSCKVLKG
jgi:hypothetical protein